MVEVKRYINNVLNSNTYVIYEENEQEAYLIDPGDTSDIVDWLMNNNKELKGIFITHSHYDHIYGINELNQKFPNLKIYCSFYAKEGMLSERLNGSLYHERPYIVECKDFNIIEEGDNILLWKTDNILIFETPGHNRDCLSFFINGNLFTGDALIPGHKVVTKLKNGDLTLAKNSLDRIFREFNENTKIWPGHEEAYLLNHLIFKDSSVGFKR